MSKPSQSTCVPFSTRFGLFAIMFMFWRVVSYVFVAIGAHKACMGV